MKILDIKISILVKFSNSLPVCHISLGLTTKLRKLESPKFHNNKLHLITLVTFTKEYVNIVTTISGKHVESYGKKDKEVKESSGEKDVEVE